MINLAKKLFIIIGTAHIALLSITMSALALDLSQFPLMTFKNFTRLEQLPDKRNTRVFDTARPGMSVGVEYTGNVREIGTNKSRFLKKMGKVIGQPTFFELYHQEIQVVEQGKFYWIPVQDSVLPPLAEELQIGQEFVAYLRYFGVTLNDLEHVYLMIEFSTRVRNSLRKLDCFTRTLVGIELGHKIEPAMEQFTNRYGPHIASPMKGTSKHYVYLIDPKYNTVLIIGDAGSGYRGKIFSIQISGPPNPDFVVYKDLKLGSTRSQINQVLGKPETQKATGDGYVRWSYKNTNCSVELKNDVLASFLIADDPNYFLE